MIYDTVNPEIVKFILEDARPGARILDIGCGTGRLGSVLKSKIGCYITGIEIDREAAQLAQKSYDEILVMDLEDLIHTRCEYKFDKKYDFIIFGDILEHVTDTKRLLECFSAALEKDGFVIASIPNVANWMIRLKLLFGNFDYSGGILDQGHVRFFTYKTARKLLEDGGYRVVRITNNNATWIIRSLGRIWKKMFAFQFVFKCSKATNSERQKCIS